MPQIRSVGTAVPPYPFFQEHLRDLARLHFSHGMAEIDRLIQVFDTVQVKRRFFSVPVDWFGFDHTFSEKNNEYLRCAQDLSIQAIERCLGTAGVRPDEIDHVIFVSSSGMATPSIDAYIINRLNFDGHVKRTPIFGLGCAGGVAGLARACDLARSDASEKILLVVLELSSLTFQRNDLSKSNLVACSLFADGAAAVLVTGDRTARDGIQIVDAQSTLFPETLDIMGWDFNERGLSVIFARSIPHVIERYIRGNIERLLQRNQIQFKDLAHYVIHPGGAKVLVSFEQALQLPPEALRHSRCILENYGNMSAPTVLFILEHLLQEGSARPGEYGICAGFGPGFSSELVLLRW